MNKQDKQRAENIIEKLQRAGGAWPRVEALDNEFGFRVYGYSRAPERVWLWFLIHMFIISIALWFGWQQGSKVGEPLLDIPFTVTIGQCVFSLIFIAGGVVFVRTVALRFLERLVEKRFEIILTREAIKLGGWFGVKPFDRDDCKFGFSIERHGESEDEARDVSMRGHQPDHGRYANTEEVVFYYLGQRVVITSICRDKKGTLALHNRLQALDLEFINLDGRPGTSI